MHVVRAFDHEIFFQLAPDDDRDDGGFPELRWAQTDNQGFTPNELLVNVFTAIAVDLPDFDSPYGRWVLAIAGHNQN